MVSACSLSSSSGVLVVYECFCCSDACRLWSAMGGWPWRVWLVVSSGHIHLPISRKKGWMNCAAFCVPERSLFSSLYGWKFWPSLCVALGIVWKKWGRKVHHDSNHYSVSCWKASDGFNTTVHKTHLSFVHSHLRCTMYHVRAHT